MEAKLSFGFILWTGLSRSGQWPDGLNVWSRTMNQQYLQYVRGVLSVALADICGSSKGQLEAFDGAALARTTRFKRQRIRSIEVDGRRVCQETEPVRCTETRSSKSQVTPIDPLTYCTSAWRRAVFKLKPHQAAWIRYCYSFDLTFDYQVEICRYIWNEYQPQLTEKPVTAKVRRRVESLVWLAVQQTAGVGHLLHGKEYSYSELAGLVGVQRNNWTMHYAPHWESLLRLAEALDADSLNCVVNHKSGR
ncbi:bacteriophage antitermination protein Q [Yersinia enterocolitica]|uniref:bacteriophage antitermination protein Q n=2 Tax=Yersiniaceae TaxID=1903411 RepID=UPI0020C952C9|nr:bacteriophage antitermination protein Q [Yersinia enterocolitica]